MQSCSKSSLSRLPAVVAALRIAHSSPQCRELLVAWRSFSFEFRVRGALSGDGVPGTDYLVRGQPGRHLATVGAGQRAHLSRSLDDRIRCMRFMTAPSPPSHTHTHTHTHRARPPVRLPWLYCCSLLQTASSTGNTCASARQCSRPVRSVSSAGTAGECCWRRLTLLDRHTDAYSLRAQHATPCNSAPRRAGSAKTPCSIVCTLLLGTPPRFIR